MDAIELKLIKFAFAYEMHSFNAPHARPAQKIPTSSALLSQKIYIYILTKNQLMQPSGWAAPGDVGPATEIFSIWCSPLRKYVNVPISCELPSNYFLVWFSRHSRQQLCKIFLCLWQLLYPNIKV